MVTNLRISDRVVRFELFDTAFEADARVITGTTSVDAEAIQFMVSIVSRGRMLSVAIVIDQEIIWAQQFGNAEEFDRIGYLLRDVPAPADVRLITIQHVDQAVAKLREASKLKPTRWQRLRSWLFGRVEGEVSEARS